MRMIIITIGTIIALFGYALSFVFAATPYWIQFIALGIVGNLIQIVGVYVIHN